MPYRLERTLLTTPDVKIFLQGQLILKPNSDGSQCDIGVNRCAPNHEFSMEVRQKMTDPDAPDVIRMRHLGTLLFPGVVIDLNPASSAGVRKFVPTDVFERDASPARDEHDLRWFVDLENHEFHNAPLTINKPGTEPNIRVRDGVFYSASLSDPAKVLVTRTGGAPSDPPLPLYRIATVIGINLYFSADKRFKLTWTRNGELQTLELEKPNSASGIKYYEIWICNDPPYINPANPPTHGELKEYYKVIDNIGGSLLGDFKRFELEFRPAPGSGTPTIPCMPVGGGH